MTQMNAAVISFFVVFCRVGGCLMTAPGFSSERVPIRMRLYLSLAVALALTPSLTSSFDGFLHTAKSSEIAATIFDELAIGVALGLLGRFFLFALETLSTSVAMVFGLGNIFGTAIAEQEASSPITSFVATCALTLVIVMDGHLEIIRALHSSYQAAPILKAPAMRITLGELVEALGQAHLLALRICSPFLLFGFVINLSTGLLSRLTPQLQAYFIAAPLVALAGIYALSLVYADFFSAFALQLRGFFHG